FTISAYTSSVLARSSLRHVALHDQELLPHEVSRSPPMESKNSAICGAERDLLPRGSISMARLPMPLVAASSAVIPPAAYILISTSGVVAIRLWRRIV